MVSYAGNWILKIFQDSGYFDRNEISNTKSKYNPGLELQLTTESLRKCDYNSKESFFFSSKKEIGILYRLKYGEMGARVMCKSYPTAQFHGNSSGHLKLFATLSETTFPYMMKRQSRSSAVGLGLGFEVNSRTSLEVMASNFQPPTFAFQFQSSNPQCLARVSRDVHLSRAGVSIALEPSSLF